MVWKGDNRNRLAKSLVTLIDEVLQKFPDRDTRNDGTIGDVRHQQEGVKSDHNPNIPVGGKGIVTALDITHDPAHGFDALAFAESLRGQKDPRIKYVIFNGRIFSSELHPWEWRARNKGPGDHSEHVHVSVVDDPKLFDDTSPWKFDLSGAATGKIMAFPPKLKRGDTGPAVHDLQNLLGIAADGVFGDDTENAVRSFQANNNLFVDGIVGSHTWGVLLASSPFKNEKPTDTMLAQEVVDEIIRNAAGSNLVGVKWKDRGVAPIGYVKGMAATYGLVYAKWKAKDSAALVMAAMNSGQDGTDALAWYDRQFRAAGMDNSMTGESTLRHLFVLLIGLGMRESSGKYFEGRDKSAHNVDADTAEAGLFQMSWNARNASSELPRLFAHYSAKPDGFLSIFQEGLQPEETENFGSGEGVAFQRLCKTCPAFAAEAAAVGLRVLRKHWGPINRQEVEIRPEADALLKKVEEIVDLKQRAPLSIPAPRPLDPVQLLVLVLMTLLKEKPMAEDLSRQGQADPLMMILPIILQSVLAGKQPNINDLLIAVLTGKPAATQGQVPPVPQLSDPLAIVLPILIQRLISGSASGGSVPASDANLPATIPAQTQPDLPALKQLKELLQTFKDLLPQQPPIPGTAPNQEQTQKILDLLKVILGPAGKLGPVNGALGQTIGNLLDGKKSAIGIIGAVITAVLQAAGPALPAALTGLVGSFPLGQVLLPIFLAMTGWGTLGKMEKWAGASAQSVSK
ncbi:peptidoglycan-binding domain-containing protein [Bradyrhizobium sp. Ai1a-2]|uniref:peptidoglycan-binding domain-containing protein n=1 Tax=Bradyrhizobium sp. Ai1a-2 TaxID=196490 RepID=UPI0013643181|nr:peptidoglycan-binding domain-containing protein [Bradyrhizobium sp. Ai1a-2]